MFWKLNLSFKSARFKKQMKATKQYRTTKKANIKINQTESCAIAKNGKGCGNECAEVAKIR